MRAANIRRSCATLAILALVSTPVAGADSPQRVLRIGMPTMPDTMDPARTDSMQAQMIVAGVFDTLYVLDPLANPAAIVPSAAAAWPGSLARPSHVHHPHTARHPLHAPSALWRKTARTDGGGLRVFVATHVRSGATVAEPLPSRRQDRRSRCTRRARQGGRSRVRLRRAGARPRRRRSVDLAHPPHRSRSRVSFRARHALHVRGSPRSGRGRTRGLRPAPGRFGRVRRLRIHARSTIAARPQPGLPDPDLGRPADAGFARGIGAPPDGGPQAAWRRPGRHFQHAGTFGGTDGVAPERTRPHPV